jgi:hypothetical protein
MYCMYSPESVAEMNSEIEHRRIPFYALASTQLSQTMNVEVLKLSQRIVLSHIPDQFIASK